MTSIPSFMKVCSNGSEVTEEDRHTGGYNTMKTNL